MFFRRKKTKKEAEVKACFNGQIVMLENVKDSMFADKVLGDGIAIEPSEGTLYAPVTGKISAVFDTKHAIGFTLENDAEILMHIGIDTVELQGKGFELNKSAGDKVTAGEIIGHIDLEYVRSNGKEMVTPLLVTDMEKYQIQFEKQDGFAEAGDVLYKVRMR